MTRIKYTLVASTSTPSDPSFGLFKIKVAELVSRIAGGCTCYNAIGWWTPTATETREKYHDAVQEGAFVLEVSAPNTAQHRVELLDGIQKAYAKAKQITGVNLKWIHCEQSEFNEKHFEI